MSTTPIHLQIRILLAGLAVASCVDEAAMDPTTPATTGTDTGTGATGSTPEVTTAVPTSSASEATGDTDDTTQTSAPVDATSAPGETTDDTTATTATTDATDTTGTSTTGVGTDTTDTTDTTGAQGTDTSTGTTAIPDTDGSSTSTGEPGETDTDAVDEGEWCGNVSTGPLVMDMPLNPVRLAASNGGPRAFAGWANKDKRLRMAVYDVEAATWGEPVTLENEYQVLNSSDSPIVAADGQGNAILAYVMQEPQSRMVTHYYDVGLGTWTRTELPVAFVQPRTGKLSMTANGHAVLSAYDRVGPGGTTVPRVWFFDPVTKSWSEPTIYPTNKDFYSDTLRWAQDPETGDVALAPLASKLLLQHRKAATDLITEVEVDMAVWLDEMVSLGGGEFMLLSDNVGLNQVGDIYVHRFDAVDWQAPEVIGSSSSGVGRRIVGGADGRAVASWGDGKWGIYARMFDVQDGWGELLTAKMSKPNVETTWNNNRVARDGEGFHVVWSASDAPLELRTYARWYDGQAWDEPSQLDPQQPTAYSRVRELRVSAPGRALATWSRDNEGMLALGYGYACRVPMQGWSEPTLLPFYPWAVQTRPDGEVLVVSPTEVEYFASP